MTGYILRRVISTIPVLFLVGVITFFLMQLVPGDPAAIMLGENATADQIAALRSSLGLDDPPLQRFGAWLLGVVQGDLGESVFYHESVASIVWDRAKISFTLAVLAQILAIIFGIGIGIWAAIKNGTYVDRFLSTIAVSGIAIPNFVLGLFLVAVFAVGLGWFLPTGFIPPWEQFGPGMQTLVLPAVALSMRQAALVARMMRGSLIDSLNSEYMVAARARGVKFFRRVLAHGVPNAMGPTVVVIGVGFGGLISGSIVIEMVFGIPGLGRLVVDAINNRDLVLLQGVMIAVTALYVFATLVADIVQAWFNPRIQLR